MFKNLTRPLCFFDIEGTGLDTGKDRIVSLFIVKYMPAGPQTRMSGFFYPGFAMDPKVIAIHGITDEHVRGCPRFEDEAQKYFEFIDGCDLGGYNLLNYDIPMLAEEFYRAGLEWRVQDDKGNPLVRILDAGNIFKKKEERTLSGAVQFYCGREIEGAHSAEADTLATADVLAAQLVRYPDLSAMSIDQLAEFSRFEKRLDLAGKIGIDAEGDPIYNIGGPDRRGRKVKDDPGFAEWMLKKDFPRQTKHVVAEYLHSLYQQEPEEDADGPFGLDIGSEEARFTPDVF
jgi:DNA polymerase III subunit epsilon